MLLAQFLPMEDMEDMKDPAIIAPPDFLSDKMDSSQTDQLINPQLRNAIRRLKFVPDQHLNTNAGTSSDTEVIKNEFSIGTCLVENWIDHTESKKQSTKLRAYEFIGMTSEVVYSFSSDSGGASPVVRRTTGPGMAFIEEVEGRTFGTGVLRYLSSDMGINDYQHGLVDQQLIEDFAETHPYFASGELEAESRETYREKMAFYFVKRALSRNLGGIDIMATALSLVAECQIRYFRSSILPARMDTEILLFGDDNALSNFIFITIKADFPSISIARVPREDAP